MHEHDVSPRLIAVEIIFLVDHRVELPLAADGHQLHTLRHGGQVVHEEVRLAIGCRKRRPVEGPTRNRKLLLRAVDRRDLLEPRHDLRDRLADRARVRHLPPVHRARSTG